MDITSAIVLNSNNGTANGVISSTDLNDTYRVELVAGATYTFSVTGQSLGDSFIRLYDSLGNFVTYDDDSGGNLNSLLTFNVATGGTYYLEVSGYADVNYGSYTIQSTADLPDNIAPALTGVSTSFGTTTVGQTITLTEASLLAGWTDANGDTLHVQNLNASSGTLTNNNNGTWSLRPTATGPITLTYEVSDGTAATTAQNSITAQAAPTPAISLTTLDNTTSEDGGTAQIQVALNVAPTGSFTVTLTSFDTTEGGFQTASGIAASQTLTFNASNWNSPQVVTLTGVQDYDNDGDVAYTVRVTAANSSTSPAANYATAIRNLSSTITLTNEGDHTTTGLDRDVPVYLIGDDGRPQQDLLNGNDGNDRLYGGYMVDELHGGIGSDRLYGGYEDDFLYGDAGNDQLYGEQDDDYLNGGDGNDRLDGGIGVDTLVGGNGNDVYYVTLADDGSIEDTIVENSNEGTDTVYIPFQVEAYVASSNVEIVRMNAGFSDTTITGNTSNNGLYGNAGSNALDGGSGNDTLDGGSGADSLLGGTGNDSLLGGNGNDTVSAGTGNDAVIGGSGNDTLLGGTGGDTMTGGSGNDVFDFNSLTETGITSTTRDVIIDFVHGQDHIDLSTIDANTATTTNNAFTGFIGATATFSIAGQLRFAGGILYGNTDTDAAAEFSIQLTGVTTLTMSDLVA